MASPNLIVGTVNASDAKIAVPLGNGNGTLTVPTTLIDTYSWSSGIAVADFDDDGKFRTPDLVPVNLRGAEKLR